MKRKRNFKTCTRELMPETNSSSSHSITIFSGNYTTKNSYKNLLRDNGKTLVIPGDGEFDRNNIDYNDVASKLQYVTFRIFEYEDRRLMLEEVLKDFTGVDNIVYNFVNDSLLEKWGEENPDVPFNECPYLYNKDGEKLDGENIIDHESTHLLDLIYEDKKTLKDFIFSSDSWLFCGECDVTEPWEKFPDMLEGDGGLLLSLFANNTNVFFPEGLERLDFEIYQFFPYCKNPMEKRIDSMYNKTQEKPWMNIEYYNYYEDDRIDDISEDEYNKLSNLWLRKDEDKWYIEIGTIPPHIKKDEVLVPYITPETFKYPFRVDFYPLNIFKSNVPKEMIEEKYKPILSINLIPSFSNFKINDTI